MDELLNSKTITASGGSQPQNAPKGPQAAPKGPLADGSLRESFIAKAGGGYKTNSQKYVCIHNSGTMGASAQAIINPLKATGVNFHMAADHKEAIQAFPLDYKCGHAGLVYDGSKADKDLLGKDKEGKNISTGNTTSFGIEIADDYEGSSKFGRAERRAAAVVAKLGKSGDSIKAHRDFTGKNCPHRTQMPQFRKFVELAAAGKLLAEGPETSQYASADDVIKSGEENTQAARGSDVVNPQFHGWTNSPMDRAKSFSRQNYAADAATWKKIQALVGASSVDGKLGDDKTLQDTIYKIAKWQRSKELLGDGKFGKNSKIAAGWINEDGTPVTAPAAGQTKAPAAGQTKAPAAGQTTAPAAGQTKAPTGNWMKTLASGWKALAGGWKALASGQMTAPAAGQMTAPAAGQMTALAGGQTTAPAAGQTVAPAASEDLIYADLVTPEFCKKVKAISGRIGVSPNDLMACMHFETGGKFKAYKYASSGAVGLIQFTRIAVEELNKNPQIQPAAKTSSEALAAMTEIDQLDYVEKYFQIHKQVYKRSMSNIGDLYMAIFCPAGVGKSDDYTLYSKGTDAYERNKGLDLNKDGRITRGEAISKPKERLEAGLKALGTQGAGQKDDKPKQDKQPANPSGLTLNEEGHPNYYAKGSKEALEIIQWNKDKGYSTSYIKSFQRFVGTNDDGDIGTKTINAIRHYQEKNNMTWKDGKWGSECESHSGLKREYATGTGASSDSKSASGTVANSKAELLGFTPSETYSESDKKRVEQQMTTISVNVNTDSGQAKKSLQIHSKLAQRFTDAFNEICNNAPDFRVVNLGGYCYRKMNNGSGTSKLSNHSWGAAIDINAGADKGYSLVTKDKGVLDSKLNPFLINGKPQESGDTNYAFRTVNHPVVAILAKHGIGWGGRYGDYMHFSYFNGC